MAEVDILVPQQPAAVEDEAAAGRDRRGRARDGAGEVAARVNDPRSLRERPADELRQRARRLQYLGPEVVHAPSPQPAVTDSVIAELLADALDGFARRLRRLERDDLDAITH